jgi:N-acyl-D-aspartate/D-glutamate deacylase
VLGDEADERAATPAELAAMSRLVGDGIAAGALGFATSSNPSHKGPGGRPVPSRLGDLAELLALVEPLRDQQRGVIAMLPGEKVQIDDVFVVQRHSGRALTWTPMLVMRDFPHQRHLEAVQAARRHGQDIWAQTAVRPIVFEENLKNPFTLTRFPALASLTGADEVVRLAAYQNPDWRAQLRREVAAGGRLDWDSAIISQSTTHPDLVGRSVGELARQRGVQPSETLLDLAIDDSLETRFSVPVANGDPEAVAPILRAEGVLLGLGDGGAHLGQLCDSCFPTTLLGTWCRDRKVLSLEEAVHKLTGEPAGFLGLADRGLIQTGYAANVCVFDPETVDSGPLSRVHDLPGGAERMVADHGSGIRHVIVNGAPIRQDGYDVEPDSRPGRVLRSARRG